MSGDFKPTPYDQMQNRWIWVAILFWAVSMGTGMAMTADIVGHYLRDEVNALRERIAILEHQQKSE